ncbi:23S ribosomal RNA methyltransferase Erm [Stackebrandtia soli]|uniref:23S ribosomal RNA methyltransferase Erm n=1 Tax=Stackebrandtia soli TaxID=1892856 RepID=UPI0039E73088
MPRTRIRLAQNFLTHPQDAHWIVDQAGVTRADTVIEVGSGRGILTAALASRVAHLTTYEIDPRLATAIERHYRDHPTVDCRQRDFLTAHPPHHPFAVVANIPYNRTAAIVDWCLAARHLTTATLLTQWEYANKRTGGYHRWTQLTISAWPRVEWRLLGRIRRTRFHPQPATDSGLLHLHQRATPLIPRAALTDYHNTVHLGFSGVGGNIGASLRRRHGSRAVTRACRDAELAPTTVVGHITPDQWIRLFRSLARL